MVDGFPTREEGVKNLISMRVCGVEAFPRFSKMVKMKEGDEHKWEGGGNIRNIPRERKY